MQAMLIRRCTSKSSLADKATRTPLRKRGAPKRKKQAPKEAIPTHIKIVWLSLSGLADDVFVFALCARGRRHRSSGRGRAGTHEFVAAVVQHAGVGPPDSLRRIEITPIFQSHASSARSEKGGPCYAGQKEGKFHAGQINCFPLDVSILRKCSGGEFRR